MTDTNAILISEVVSDDQSIRDSECFTISQCYDDEYAIEISSHESEPECIDPVATLPAPTKNPLLGLDNPDEVDPFQQLEEELDACELDQGLDAPDDGPFDLPPPPWHIRPRVMKCQGGNSSGTEDIETTHQPHEPMHDKTTTHDKHASSVSLAANPIMCHFEGTLMHRTPHRYYDKNRKYTNEDHETRPDPIIDELASSWMPSATKKDKARIDPARTRIDDRCSYSEAAPMQIERSTGLVGPLVHRGSTPDGGSDRDNSSLVSPSCNEVASDEQKNGNDSKARTAEDDEEVILIGGSSPSAGGSPPRSNEHKSCPSLQSSSDAKAVKARNENGDIEFISIDREGTLPHTRAGRFLTHASESAMVKRLGISKETIDETISRLNCFDGMVKIFDSPFFKVHREGNQHEHGSGSSGSGSRSGK